MDITIRTESGKQIISLTMKEALYSIVGLVSIVWAFLTNGDPLKRVWGYILDIFSPSSGQEVSIEHIVSVFLFLASLFSIWVFVGKVCSATRNIKDHRRCSKGKNITDLINEKIFGELQGCNLSSTTDFNQGCELAKQDEEKLRRAFEEGHLNNKQVYVSDWKHFINESSAINYIRDIPIDINEFRITRNNVLEEIKKISREDRDKYLPVEFHVASVQPSILLAVRKLIEECGLGDCVRLVSNVCTGPETVKSATSIVKESSCNKVVMFAAPLSAFVMAECRSLEESPSNFFYPVCSVIDEQQEILVIENGKKVPVRKGYIHYYDNSTAEEHIANIYETTSSYVEFVPVTNYYEYKNILNGEHSATLTMQPGDGIVVWPPLTEYFKGRSVAGGYFVNNGVESVFPTKSKIMLYCEKHVLDKHGTEDNKYELAHKFSKAVITELRHLRHEIEQNKVNPQLNTWKKLYLSGFAGEFSKLV